MHQILVHDDPGGILEISGGVARATRIAEPASGQTIPIAVIGPDRRSRASSRV